jgi:hypothetical protein
MRESGQEDAFGRASHNRIKCVRYSRGGLWSLWGKDALVYGTCTGRAVAPKTARSLSAGAARRPEDRASLAPHEYAVGAVTGDRLVVLNGLELRAANRLRQGYARDKAYEAAGRQAKNRSDLLH